MTTGHPTKDEVLGYLRDRRNWGRWGADDQRGAINLITPEKRVRAALVVGPPTPPVAAIAQIAEDFVLRRMPCGHRSFLSAEEH